MSSPELKCLLRRHLLRRVLQYLLRALSLLGCCIAKFFTRHRSEIRHQMLVRSFFMYVLPIFGRRLSLLWWYERQHRAQQSIVLKIWSWLSQCTLVPLWHFCQTHSNLWPCVPQLWIYTVWFFIVSQILHSAQSININAPPHTSYRVVFLLVRPKND